MDTNCSQNKVHVSITLKLCARKYVYLHISQCLSNKYDLVYGVTLRLAAILITLTLKVMRNGEAGHFKHLTFYEHSTCMQRTNTCKNRSFITSDLFPKRFARNI